MTEQSMISKTLREYIERICALNVYVYQIAMFNNGIKIYLALTSDGILHQRLTSHVILLNGCIVETKYDDKGIIRHDPITLEQILSSIKHVIIENEPLKYEIDGSDVLIQWYINNVDALIGNGKCSIHYLTPHHTGNILIEDINSNDSWQLNQSNIKDFNLNKYNEFVYQQTNNRHNEDIDTF